MDSSFVLPFDFRLLSLDEVIKALGHRLRDQRMSQLLTQQALSVRAGVSLGAIKKLESTGKVTVETLVAVSRALGIVNELNIFSIPAQTSIADMQRRELAQRKRARKPRVKMA